MATPTFPKINFAQIKASLVVRVGTNVKNIGPHFMGFQWPPKKGFDQQLLRQQINDFQIKLTKILTKSNI